MTKRVKDTLIFVAAVAVAFGVGAVWQFTDAQEARAQRDDARQELATAGRQQVLDHLEATLSQATIAAQFGDFERSRRFASDFFDLLQKRSDVAPEAVRPALGQILARRDATITVLSRAQPESGLELAVLLTSLQHALGKEPTVAAYAPIAPEEPRRN